MVTAGPSRSAAALLAGLGVLLGAVGLAGDAAGRLLALPAALVLLALGLRDLVLTPVLRADAAGLEVVTGARRLRVPWRDVGRLRVVVDRRAPLLEIDLRDTLVVLGRHRLGRAPGDVLTELQALRGSGC